MPNYNYEITWLKIIKYYYVNLSVIKRFKFSV